jgi:hypothetical protein
MSDLQDSCTSYSGLVEKYIGTAYDVVYAVYLALGEIDAIYELLLEFGAMYYGSLPDEPAKRPDGSPSEEGDMYFNSTVNILYIYSDGLWIVPIANASFNEVVVITNSHIVGNDTIVTLEGTYVINSNAIQVFVNGSFQYSKNTKSDGAYTETDGNTLVFDDVHLIAGDVVVCNIGTSVNTVNPNISVKMERYVTSSINEQVITIPGGTTYVVGTNNLQVYLDGKLQYPGIDYFETTEFSITFASPLTDIGTIVIFKKGTIVTNSAPNIVYEAGIAIYELITDFNAKYAEEKITDVIFLKAYSVPNDGNSGTYIYDLSRDRAEADGINVVDSSVDIPTQGMGVGSGCWIKQA